MKIIKTASGNQIKLSKSEWQLIGKIAGWIKESEPEKECHKCKGNGRIIQKVKDLGTLDYRDSIETCDMCNGKGHITKEDQDRYLHNMGVAPCPCKKASSSNEIYLLDNGILYDDEAEEVFNMKKLIKYFKVMKEMGITKIPKFHTSEQANKFLTMIEDKTGDSLGRVLAEDVDPRKTIRYKDTKEERQRADLEYLEEKNQEFKKGIVR